MRDFEGAITDKISLSVPEGVMENFSIAVRNSNIKGMI
jgi:hypothetical protein